VRVADYSPSRRADAADLIARVWGKRPDEAELEWFYERNPVRPASVLLAEEDGLVVGSAAISFQRLEMDLVGFAVHLATDPSYRGRGIFSELQTTNEGRARDAGVSLLLTVPTPESARILIGKLGWTSLPPLRVWARPWLPARVGAQPVERFENAWLDWRFADAPREYTLLAGDGYAVVGKRGRFGFVAALDGDLLADACAAARGVAVLAAPPPAQHGRYLRAGFLPTPKTFTLLGKSLDGSPLPERPHLELGDLDFL
jgi:GNAT superfamily N-acetyltransferase